MADYQILKESVAAVIKNNGNQEISGDLLQSTLFSIINTLGTGYQFAGVASSAVVPGTPDAKLFYVAEGPGIYDHFNNLVVNDGELAFFIIPGGGASWYKMAVPIGVAGFAMYGTGRYPYGSLPAIPTVKGRYFVIAYRVVSGVYYEYLYTSDPAVNGGVWTNVRQTGRMRVLANESVTNRRPDTASLAYMYQEIDNALNFAIDATNLENFSGSWADADSEYFPGQDYVETAIVPLASSARPVCLRIDYQNYTEILPLTYRFETQGTVRLVFGGLGTNFGKTIEMEIDTDLQTINIELYEI